MRQGNPPRNVAGFLLMRARGLFRCDMSLKQIWNTHPHFPEPAAIGLFGDYSMY